MSRKMNKKIFFLVAISLIVVVFLAWFAFAVQLKNIKTVSDDIQKAQLDASVRQERKQKILELGKKLGNIESDQMGMSAMFVDKNDAVPFLEDLESIATTTGNEIAINVVDLAKLKPLLDKAVPSQEESDEESEKTSQNQAKAPSKPKTKAPKEDYSNQLGFTVVLSGEYDSLVDFFTKLENMPYFVRVYNFQIASDAKKIKIPENEIPQAQNQSGAGQEEKNKTIKSILTIGVYANGSK
jgi:hypothetical protein